MSTLKKLVDAGVGPACIYSPNIRLVVNEKTVNISKNLHIEPPKKLHDIFLLKNLKTQLVNNTFKSESSLRSTENTFIFNSNLTDFNLSTTFTNPRQLKDTVYCKKSKNIFIRESDWNFKFGVIEFRTCMFEKSFETNPFISFEKDSNEKINHNSPFNLEVFEILYRVNYHDIETLKIIKYGTKCCRMRAKNGSRFLDGPAFYDHSPNNEPYFEKTNFIGPFTKDQLLKKFDFVTVGTVLPISRTGKEDRYVVDHRKHMLEIEAPLVEHKMRLPSLREIVLYVDIDEVKSISIFDMKSYFRIIHTHEFNYPNAVLKRFLGNSPTPVYVIDQFMQQGQFESPRDAQRISAAIAFIFNLICKFEKPELKTLCLPYEDDFCLFHYNENGEEAARCFEEFVVYSGLEIQKAKDVVNKQVATWIGITFDLVNKCIYPSKKRINSIVQQLKSLKNQKKVDHRGIQSLIGKFASISQMCTLKALMYKLRELDREHLFEGDNYVDLEKIHLLEIDLLVHAMQKIGEKAAIKFDAIKAVVIRDNVMFKSNLTDGSKIKKLSDLMKIGTKVAETVCVTDSSLKAAGGVILSRNFAYLFDFKCDDHFKNFSIDKLESIALVVAALLAISKFETEGILFMTDNEVTRYILSKCNASSEFLRKLTTLFSHFMLNNSCYSTVIRITTEENFISDGISRGADVSSCLDMPHEWIPRQEIEKSIKVLKYFCYDIPYPETVNRLALEDSRNDSGSSLGNCTFEGSSQKNFSFSE